MSKFIRALALFSLTIGLAGCLHSDDDTVFITLPPVDGGGGVVDETDDITDDLVVAVTERQAPILDTDRDGIPDAIDLDDDGDNIPDATDTDFTDDDGNGIDDTVEAAFVVQTIVQASTDDPVFPLDGISSPERTDNAQSAQEGIRGRGITDSGDLESSTQTNIIYRPRANLGLVVFDSAGTPSDRRVVPQTSAREEINARVDNRRYAYYGEAVSTATLTLSEVAYFAEQGALMEFAALAYWIDSPSDALDFSADHSLSEIGAGVFGLETAPVNLPRGYAEYRGAMNGFYRKASNTEFGLGFNIRPENAVNNADVSVNIDDNLQNDIFLPVVVSTGAQNYVVEGQVNLNANFFSGRVDGGFTATAYEPNYRLDWNPETGVIDEYNPDAERNDETFSQYLRGGDYHVPNRGGLRPAPAGLGFIPTIGVPRLDAVLDSNGVDTGVRVPVLDAISGFPIVDQIDAVVLPTRTAVVLDGAGEPVLDAEGRTIPIRAMTDSVGAPILDTAEQLAIRYNPLGGEMGTRTIGCSPGTSAVGGLPCNGGTPATPTTPEIPGTLTFPVWVVDAEGALAVRRSLANTLPDPFSGLRPPAPITPSILQGQFSGVIINGRFAGTTAIGVSETPTGATVSEDRTEVLFLTQAEINLNPGDYTYGTDPVTGLPRTSSTALALRRTIREVVRDDNLNVFFPTDTIVREEAVTDGDDNPLFIVSRTTSTQVPETTEEAIEPTGVFSPLSDGGGIIRGQFFGPNGEETGGSGNLADMDGNELVFAFGGRRDPPPNAPDAVDLSPELTARLAQVARLNELFRRIVPESVFDDPANFEELTPESEALRVSLFLDAAVLAGEITEDARPDPQYFNRITPAGGRTFLFDRSTVSDTDRGILANLDAAFRMNSGIVENEAMLNMLDTTGQNRFTTP